MITGWLLKIVLSIAVVGALLFELGSPLVTRAQLDGVAHDAADNAALELLNRPGNIEGARAEALEIITKEDAFMKDFAVVDNRVRITVGREARSFLLKKVEQLRNWYDVEVTVTSTGKR